jgi:hypothetical protein
MLIVFKNLKFRSIIVSVIVVQTDYSAARNQGGVVLFFEEVKSGEHYYDQWHCVDFPLKKSLYINFPTECIRGDIPLAK